MRFLSCLSMLLLAVLLSACGGGGGSAGTTSGSAPAPVTPPAALFTTAPASITVAVGAAQEYSISGGAPPYKVFSSNVQVSVAGVKDAAFTIGGIAPGAATITVSDAAAKTSVVTVTVGNLAPFATNAPATLTLLQSTKNSFTLSGGVPGYSVVSADSRFVTATVTGTTLNINAVALTAIAVPVQVSDAAGTVLTITVTVGSSSTLDVFSTAPAALSLAPQSTATFTIGGGTPPYSVTSSNTSAATVSINGGVLTITSFSPSTAGSGNVATITVRDANAKTATPIVVTVTALPFVLSATTITAFVGRVIDVTISGGTPPYRVASSLPAAVTATLSPSQTDFRLTLNSPSTVDVFVLDANNQQQKLTVTVIAGTPSLGLSPSALTVSETDTQDILLTVLGAAAGTPPRVFSSDTGRLKVSPISGNTVTVSTGSSRCVDKDTAVSITVIDSNGASGTATITIKDNGNTAAVAASGSTVAVAASNCPP